MYGIYKLMHHVLAEYNGEKYPSYEEAEAALRTGTTPIYIDGENR